MCLLLSGCNSEHFMPQPGEVAPAASSQGVPKAPDRTTVYPKITLNESPEQPPPATRSHQPSVPTEDSSGEPSPPVPTEDSSGEPSPPVPTEDSSGEPSPPVPTGRQFGRAISACFESKGLLCVVDLCCGCQSLHEEMA